MNRLKRVILTLPLVATTCAAKFYEEQTVGAQ
jgi:hypothetical protein